MHPEYIEKCVQDDQYHMHCLSMLFKGCYLIITLRCCSKFPLTQVPSISEIPIVCRNTKDCMLMYVYVCAVLSLLVPGNDSCTVYMYVT